MRSRRKFLSVHSGTLAMPLLAPAQRGNIRCSEKATRLEIAVNLKATGAIDLTATPTLLARADEVIE